MFIFGPSVQEVPSYCSALAESDPVYPPANMVAVCVPADQPVDLAVFKLSPSAHEDPLYSSEAFE